MNLVLLMALGGGCLVVVVLALLLLNNRNAEPTSGAQPGTTAPPNEGGTTSGWGGGALLGTVMSEAWRVVFAKGTGAGKKHAGSRDFRDRPFPVSTGAVVSFDVKFDANFEWSCGGKIGGLFVGTGKASGGNYSANGASHRVMWDDDGGVFSYVYIPKGSDNRQPALLSKAGNYGQGIFKDEFARSFTTDKWYTVHCGIQLNSPGKSDGKLLFGVNSKIKVLNGVVWRLNSDPVTRFSFGLFHGGPCSAARQSTANLRNVRVYRWDS